MEERSIAETDAFELSATLSHIYLRKRSMQGKVISTESRLFLRTLPFTDMKKKKIF